MRPVRFEWLLLTGDGDSAFRCRYLGTCLVRTSQKLGDAALQHITNSALELGT